MHSVISRVIFKSKMKVHEVMSDICKVKMYTVTFTLYIFHFCITLIRMPLHLSETSGVSNGFKKAAGIKGVTLSRLPQEVQRTMEHSLFPADCGIEQVPSQASYLVIAQYICAP